MKRDTEYERQRKAKLDEAERLVGEAEARISRAATIYHELGMAHESTRCSDARILLPGAMP